MKLLLTNDDGIDAPGLRALFEAVTAAVGPQAELFVAAPHCGRSECGHSVTTGRPLVIEEVRPRWYSIDGTPVDCVRAALAALVPDATAVISGVNAGANLGIDLLVSGTFAAAREAAIERVPAMAVSHCRHRDVPASWEHVGRWLADTLQEFLHVSAQDVAAPNGHRPLTPLWNVNLPAVMPDDEIPPRVHCQVDWLPLKRTGRLHGTRLSIQSDFHGRPRTKGHDVDRCFSGHITISQLSPWL